MAQSAIQYTMLNRLKEAPGSTGHKKRRAYYSPNKYHMAHRPGRTIAQGIL